MSTANQHVPPVLRAVNRPAGHWLWALAVMAVVFVASGRGQVAAPGIVNFDKVAHTLVFGLIATLIARSFRRRPWMWAAILFASAYGAMDEVRQSFTPGRSVEVDDWIADTLGACLAVTLYQLWPWYRRLLETPIFKRRVEKSSAPVPTEAAL